MQYPIPSPPPAGYDCYVVYWPKGREWYTLLRGLLLTPTRGRFWDESSGSIIGVQATAWDMYYKNTPLLTCREFLEAECTPPQGAGGGAMIIGDEDMGQVVTDVKIEDGMLVVYFGPCCRVELDNWCCGSVQEDADAPEYTPPESGTISACAKAFAVVDVVYATAQAIWDTSEELHAPWGYISAVQNKLGGLDLKNGYVASGLVHAGEMRILGYDEEDVFDANTRQLILCQVAGMLSDDVESMTREQWSRIKDIFNAGHGLLEEVLFGYAAAAIGYDLANAVVRAGAYDTDRNCDCPGFDVGDEYSTPNASGWYLSDPLDAYTIDYVNDEAERHLIIDHTPQHDVFGAVWSQEVAGLNYKVMDAAPVDPTILDYGLDTSGNESGQRSRVCWGPGVLWDLLFGSGAYYHLGEGNLDSITPESPNPEGVADARQGIAAESVFNHQGSIHMSQVRFLHNTNSPSHSGG